jgi:translocation and assembly module TamA
MPARCWRLTLAGIVLCLSMLSALQANAQTFAVEIVGAGELTPLLEEHLTLTRLAREGRARPEEWQRLVRATPEQMTELLATEGYFSPQIDSEQLANGDDRVARFRVQLGEPVRVTEVRIDFRGALAKQDTERAAGLRAGWTLMRGERFRQQAWQAAKDALLGDLLVRDYPAARISSSVARIDPKNRSASLQVDIDSGPAFTFGELDIRGLERYPPDLVRRTNLIRSGERFSQARLSELQARLLATGYFRSVFASIDSNPDHSKRVPIRVDLAENPSKRLGLGIGLSTDSGPRLQLRWTDRQFLGRDWRLESVLRIDRISLLAQGELYFRPLREGLLGNHFEGWIPSVVLGLERTSITGVEVERIRNSVRLSTPSHANERVVSVSLLADRPALPGGEVFTRRALMGGYQWTRRRFDQLLVPTRGYSATVDLSAGFGGALNDSGIARVFFNGIWLRPLSEDWTLAARLQAGEIVGAGLENVPEDLLFRTGGDQTVRGYRFGSLGVPRNGAIVGGNVLALASVELIRYLTPDWGAAVFHDIGDAALSWSDYRARRGVGIGARWRSPIGAVNIDLARGLDAGDTRLHFSVGYGF